MTARTTKPTNVIATHRLHIRAADVARNLVHSPIVQRAICWMNGHDWEPVSGEDLFLTHECTRCPAVEFSEVTQGEVM